MMRMPSNASIEVVEHRLLRSRKTVRSSLRRARASFLFKATKPSSLALAAGLAGLFGFFSSARGRETPVVEPRRVVRETPVRPLMISLLGVAIRSVPFMLWRLRLARSKRLEGAEDMSGGDGPEPLL